MSIIIIGTGYVGLVSGTCFADLGHQVCCIDRDENKIKGLSQGKVPFYEPGLEERITRNVQAGRLTFSTSIEDTMDQASIIFNAVGTPSKNSGEADLSQVYSVIDSLIAYVSAEKNARKRVLVNKSTVPVLTGEKIKIQINEAGLSENLVVVSNPEFLREGTAVHDFFHPDRIVLGSYDQEAMEKVARLYEPLYRLQTPIIKTDLQTAELAKYASNAFLATKISFINEMANLCEIFGANIKEISNIMGKDGRIGRYFLHAGPGYGGSCFPKDVKALVHAADENDYDFKIGKAVEAVNQNQRLQVIKKLKQFFPEGLFQKRIAIAGLSYKPNTDDVRESPSLSVINELLLEEAEVSVFDPEAIPNTKKIYGEKLHYCHNSYEAATGADAFIIMTEWNMFRELNLNTLKETMNFSLFLDFRGIYQSEDLNNAGFKHYIIGQTITS